MPSIALIEDNTRLADSLSRGLTEAGYTVTICRDGVDGLAQIATGRHDLVILDLGLPRLDGAEVLRRARTASYGGPVLVLSARGELDSRVETLDLGADDYLTKPFALDELLARVRALLRRAAGPRWSSLSFGDLRLDLEHTRVFVDQQVVVLSPREYSLLACLLRGGGNTVTRAQILADVFGQSFDPGTNVIDVHVSHLRTRLDGSRVRIESVRAVGYRLADSEGGP